MDHDRIPSAQSASHQATQLTTGPFQATSQSPVDACTAGGAWDVIVIGAGPAGTAAAISCAKHDLKVLLVDSKRFPRHKVCGGCLNQVSLAILHGLIGAAHPLWQSSLPLQSFRLTHAGRQFGFSTPQGLAVSRAELDQSLVEEALRVGAVFEAPVTARLAGLSQGYRLVKLNRGGCEREVSTKLVVLACGLDNRLVTTEPSLRHTSRPNSRVGIEAIYPRALDSFEAGTIHMIVGRQGYVGITHIHGNQSHVAAAVDKSALQGSGPQKLVHDILREAGASPLPKDFAVTWRGTLPLTSRARRLGAERVLLVGDSAGYIEPFTGEGIRWALQGGVALGEFARAACNQWSPGTVDRWEAWYAEHIYRDQRLCRLLSWGLKRSVARWLAHSFLRTTPVLANGIIHRINQKATV